MDPISLSHVRAHYMPPTPGKIHKGYFRVGTFHRNPYTIRVSFDQIRGFQARVSQRSHAPQYPELTAPFAKIKNISVEQLAKLSSELRTYSIRLIVEEDKLIRVEFTPKLLGAGVVFSKLIPPDEELKEEIEEEKEEESQTLPENFGTKNMIEKPTRVLFYANLVTTKPGFKEELFQFIEKSKTDPSLAMAAANSMTILNAARVPFSGLDLAKVKAPGAYLQDAILDGTILDDADISGATLTNAFLRECSLKNTRMADVQFGERPYLEHLSSCGFVAISPNGEWVTSIPLGNSIELWDFHRGKKIKTFSGHTDFVESCVFSSDNKWLASSSKDKTVRIWDIQSGKEWKKLEHPINEIGVCSFSPDGKWVISTCSKQLYVWDLQSGEKVNTLEGDSTVFSYSPDGKWIAYTVSYPYPSTIEHSVRLWNPQTGEVKNLKNNKRERVSHCTFSPDGKLLATVSQDDDSHKKHFISLWNVLEGKKQKTLVTNLTANCYSVFCVFSPNGRWLAIQSNETILILDIQTGKILKRISEYPTSGSCAFSPDSQWLIAGNMLEIRIWNVQANKIWSRDKLDSISSCIFLPDGESYAFTDKQETRILNLKTKKEIKSIKIEAKGILLCTLSPKGKWLAAIMHLPSSENNAVVLKGLQEEKWTKSIMGSRFTSCHFSSDEKLLGVKSHDNKVRIWDMESWEEINSFSHENTIEDSISDYKFSSNGKWFVTCSNKIIYLWDLRTKKELKTFGHQDTVRSCSLSPDDKWLVSASKDGTLRLWDLLTGEELRKFNHKDVVAYSFSPRDMLIVFSSCGPNSTICFWDPDTGKELKRIEGIYASSLKFSHDGKWLTTMEHSHLLLWKLYDKHGHLNPRLEWASSPHLAAHGAIIESAKELSPLNRQLLLQHGAKDEEKNNWGTH